MGQTGPSGNLTVWTRVVDVVDLPTKDGDIPYKVMPQFVNAKLVNITPITLGLMNGGYVHN